MNITAATHDGVMSVSFEIKNVYAKQEAKWIERELYKAITDVQHRYQDRLQLEERIRNHVEMVKDSARTDLNSLSMQLMNNAAVPLK